MKNLLQLWKARREFFEKRVATLKSTDAAPQDLINAEAKLAELTECIKELETVLQHETTS